MSKAKANFARWTQEENDKFEKLLAAYNKDFRKIAQHFQTRTYGQIRTHYYNEVNKHTEQPVQELKQVKPISPPIPKQVLIKAPPSQDSQDSIKHKQNKETHNVKQELLLPKKPEKVELLIQQTSQDSIVNALPSIPDFIKYQESNNSQTNPQNKFGMNLVKQQLGNASVFNPYSCESFMFSNYFQ
ncbi:MYB_DNA binding protein/ transcription factor-like protein [Hexamita inflata]|uniref:MYB DNA binding protein/ transcription factor-like protein n=1 Tax=Hexamita inflata TaxID=28002 RepID=A0AA86NQM2_9EUKA|nr:MYB DNA binding protein/ transcription factor-like protein [Hexamita inflata]